MSSLVKDFPAELQERCRRMQTDAPHHPAASKRWDGADLTQFEGTYFDYLSKKVAAAIPTLATEHIQDRGSRAGGVMVDALSGLLKVLVLRVARIVART
jgi:hypothetical protein